MELQQNDKRHEKQRLRDQLNQEVQRFLAAGGEIKTLESHYRPCQIKTAHQSLWQRIEVGFDSLGF
ncbi:MAG: hypothetical protein P8O79_01915 [Halieaceae bacterium]|nr:hypothetical protein [Halieaceae bacterium]